MPRYRVTARALVDSRLVNPGEIVDLPSTTLPGFAFEPVDAEGAALKAEQQMLRRDAMPEGSTSERHIRDVVLGNIAPTAEAILSAYHRPVPIPELEIISWPKAALRLARGLK